MNPLSASGIFPLPDDETRWAWWSRHIYVNRYILPPKPVYNRLLDLVKDKDYFVITTNVDHQFQTANRSFRLQKTEKHSVRKKSRTGVSASTVISEMC